MKFVVYAPAERGDNLSLKAVDSTAGVHYWLLRGWADTVICKYIGM